ncbi:MAG: hypothetical protein ACHQIL_11515, partial [Steroidobacterales bacterium]
FFADLFGQNPWLRCAETIELCQERSEPNINLLCLPFYTHLLRPARGGAAGVVLVFSVGLALAAQAGLMGLPLGVLLVSWYFKYCYFLFDSVVRGFDDPPVLDIQMLNPFGERRPIVQLGIAGAVYGLIELARIYIGWPVAVALGVLAAASLPASVAVLGLEENIFKAMSPRHLIRLVHGLGVWYAAVLGVIAGYAALLYLWWQWMPWLVLRLVGLMFAILSIVSTLAGAIYARRHELGIEVWHSPERREERLRREVIKKNEHVVDAAYNQARIGAHGNATRILVDWLQSRGNEPEDYHWLCMRLASWKDSRHLLRVSADYVDWLLRLRRNSEALDLVAQRLKAFPDFRPASAATTLQIAQIAARGGSPSVARALLADFPTRYAGDPSVGAAQALAGELESGAR